MNVLVCVKRVPLTGGKITLTEDEQAIQTRHLGFTVSPHEECAAEEAIRLVEAHGGESVVLTLGPADAEEQLRDMMAIGIDRGIHLVTDGGEWDPQATAAAIVAAIREDGTSFDLLMFGNESADAGNYQVAVRVAYALGLPVVNGIKGISVDGASLRCERENVPPTRARRLCGPHARRRLGPGGHQPAALSVCARADARQAQAGGRLRAGPRVGAPGDGAAPATRGLEQAGRGPGPRRRGGPPGRGDPVRDRSDVMATLVFIEAAADELSQQAVTLAHTLGDDVSPVAFDPSEAYAPAAWAQTLVELAQQRSAGAVVAPGTDRGNEVLAHVAAKLDQPMSANCLSIAPGEPATVMRMRWGGSLLEEARVHGSPLLVTAAPHAVAAAPLCEVEVVPVSGSASEADRMVRVSETIPASSAGVSLADADVVVSGGRGVGSAEGFSVIEELAALLGGAVGCSRAVTSAGWRPHTDQVGQTGTKISPEIYIACGISGATQHMAGCKGAKRLLAINPDGEASIFASADYAVIGDLHEVVPAISAEIRKVRGT